MINSILNTTCTEDSCSGSLSTRIDFIDDSQIQEIAAYKCRWTIELQKKKEVKKALPLNGSPQLESSTQPFEAPTFCWNPSALTPATLINYAQRLESTAVMTEQKAHTEVEQAAHSSSVNEFNKSHQRQKMEEQLIPLTSEQKETLLRLPNKSCMRGNVLSTLNFSRHFGRWKIHPVGFSGLCNFKKYADYQK